MNTYQAIYLFVILVVIPAIILKAWWSKKATPLRCIACMASIAALTIGAFVYPVWIFNYLGAVT